MAKKFIIVVFITPFYFLVFLVLADDVAVCRRLRTARSTLGADIF
jgi:hypothetical protein